MSEFMTKLVQLIKENKYCNEICEELNITNKQLFNYITILENKGYEYKRKYYSDGSIKYCTIKKYVDTLEDKYHSTIITDNKENNFKVLLVSDLHWGDKLAQVELMDRAFNYCTKNDIHSIICLGDLIDGSFGKSNEKKEEIEKQIEYFVKNYPFDKNILTFGIGGNHDVSGLYTDSIDMTKLFKNYRHDIIIDSYYNKFINIKNDTISLSHYKNKMSFKENSPILLFGHYHKYHTEYLNNGYLSIQVPSLSNICEYNVLPTALELELQFKKGYIENAIIKQIYFGAVAYILNESKYELLKNRNVEFGNINNTENYKSFSDNNTEKKLIKK